MGFQKDKQEIKFLIMFERSFHLPQGHKTPSEKGFTGSRFTLGLTPRNRPTPKKEFMVVLVSLKFWLVV